MTDGIGCKCMARYEGECACDGVDWTPQETIDLRAELAAISKALDDPRTDLTMTMVEAIQAIKAENQKLRDAYADEVNYNNALRNAFQAIINTAPGSAHRIARMALG